MKNLYTPTLLTQAILDELSETKEYVLIGPDDEPYAMVKKDWLERRVGACKILYQAVKNKDLFGVPIPQEYFKASTYEKDDGWMMMYCSGRSSSDNKDWCVTTEQLKGDEIPDECTDAKSFSILVARLLNMYYNKLIRNVTPKEQ